MRFDDLTDRQFVDFVRVAIGLLPLSVSSQLETCGSYLRLERLCRAAKPDCKRCGGSGYYDGDCIDSVCECTGFAKRAPRAPKPRPHDPRFAYRRRHV